MNWLYYGDRNTTFFPLESFPQKIKNHISTLQDLDDSWTSNDRQLGTLLFYHCSNLFTAYHADISILDHYTFTPINAQPKHLLRTSYTTHEIHNDIWFGYGNLS